MHIEGHQLVTARRWKPGITRPKINRTFVMLTIL